MLLGAFARLFSKRIWEHAKILVIGTVLSPAERTIPAFSRVKELSSKKNFQNYHRVLNGAVWSSQEASRILLGLLINALAKSGPVILGLDDTMERRSGTKIKAKGIYQDLVRSTDSHSVKDSGLRWLSLMLVAPPERYYKTQVREHKNLIRPLF